MKTFLNCLIVCLFLFSCKKETALENRNKPESTGKKYPVSFNIADFAPSVIGSSKGNSIADVPLAGRAKYFTYIAYNEEGTEVSRIKQDSTGFSLRIARDPAGGPPDYYPINASAFGCISDTLASGQYTIVMLASKADYSINYRSEEAFEYSFTTFPDASFYYTRGLESWSRAEDTFFKKFSITVSETDSQHKITLDRIVGKAEINILDSRPGTIFRFFFINENEAFRFSTELPFGITDDVGYDFAPRIPGKEKLTFSKFLLNTATPVNVLINVYDNANLDSPIVSKTITGVRFYKNKRTILTGNIYSDPPASTGFSVKVNDQFDPDTVNVSF